MVGQRGLWSRESWPESHAGEPNLLFQRVSGYNEVLGYESCTDDRSPELIDMAVITGLSMDFNIESMLVMDRSYALVCHLRNKIS